MLVLISNRHSAKINFSTFSCQQYLRSITGSAIMQSHTIQQNVTVCFLLYIQITNTDSTCMCFFQLIQIKHRILSCKDFYYLCCKEVHIIHSMITNQQTGLCTIFQNNQHTAVHHEIDICTKNIHQLDRFFHYYILRHIENYAILRKSRIKGGHTIF